MFVSGILHIMLRKLLFYIISIFIVLECYQCTKSDVPKKVDVKKEFLPPCEACKTLSNSFLKGMTVTNKKHFGGGDTAWEEEKLGDYAKSEVRLVEIQENLCSESHKAQQQCYLLAEEWENFIEEWWFSEQQHNNDFFKWLCIEKVRYCCPENHFGPECKPCTGYPDKICSNNGKCKGAGTRNGSGTCICNKGYTGSNCDKCSKLYYISYKENDSLICSKCHDACLEFCSSSGPEGCNDCNIGWIKDPQYGCLDIDECTTSNPCKENEVCVNNDGSYICREEEKKSSVNWTQYFVYLGLCITTFIIFKRNTVIASFIGLSVAVYVLISEYMLHTISNQS